MSGGLVIRSTKAGWSKEERHIASVGLVSGCASMVQLDGVQLDGVQFDEALQTLARTLARPSLSGSATRVHDDARGRSGPVCRVMVTCSSVASLTPAGRILRRRMSLTKR